MKQVIKLQRRKVGGLMEGHVGNIREPYNAGRT